MDVSALIEDVNYVAVVLAALANFFVGSIWYHKAVFGAKWMELTGMTEDKAKEGMMMAFGGGFVTTLVSAFVLALVLSSPTDWADGLLDGALIGLGFSAAGTIMHALYEQKSKDLMLINAGYGVVGFAVMGLVLALFA